MFRRRGGPAAAPGDERRGGCRRESEGRVSDRQREPRLGHGLGCAGRVHTYRHATREGLAQGADTSRATCVDVSSCRRSAPPPAQRTAACAVCVAPAGPRVTIVACARSTSPWRVSSARAAADRRSWTVVTRPRLTVNEPVAAVSVVASCRATTVPGAVTGRATKTDTLSVPAQGLSPAGQARWTETVRDGATSRWCSPAGRRGPALRSVRARPDALSGRRRRRGGGAGAGFIGRTLLCQRRGGEQRREALRFAVARSTRVGDDDAVDVVSLRSEAFGGRENRHGPFRRREATRRERSPRRPARRRSRSGRILRGCLADRPSR